VPKCFPPVSTVRGYFYAWRDAGLFDPINTVLEMNLREIEGRQASPTADVIDSQSIKTTESRGISGYDAGIKVKGTKRHIVTEPPRACRSPIGLSYAAMRRSSSMA